MAKELSTQSKWKPWKGVLLFVIAFAWLIGGSMIQMAIGMPGLLILQLGFLAIAIIACLINKTPLKEVFPIKKITVRDFFGSLLLWAGSAMLGFISVIGVGLLLPETFGTVASTLNEMAVGSGVLVLSFIGMVICPPICEEAIMRGAVLSNFRGIKKDWVIVLIIGIMFGILHTDPIRFINTALLGGAMAYVMVKRNNFILPMIMHFINNFITIGISILGSVAGSQATDASTAEATASAVSSVANLSTLGSLLALFCIAPVFIVIGSHLIKRQKEISEGSEKKGMKLGLKIAIAAVLSVAMLVSGLVITLNNSDIKVSSIGEAVQVESDN